MSTIGIVGMGWVGSSVAISILQRGIARTLLVNDIQHVIAEGEAMDLDHGSMFYPFDAEVRAVSLAQIVDEADAVVLCAGRGGTAGETRLDLLRDNTTLARDLASGLAGFDGIVIVVTNPVDVLTQIVTEETGLPPGRVLGTGTMLDTARLRFELAGELRVHPRSIHAQVVGEHGDSEVCLWSSSSVGGRPLRADPSWSADVEEAVATRVRRAAYEIIQRKGATNHAIGLVTAQLLGAILDDERRVFTVSTVQDGVAGISGVALSLPTIVGEGGAAEVLEPSMDERERDALARSAETLKAALRDARG